MKLVQVFKSKTVDINLILLALLGSSSIGDIEINQAVLTIITIVINILMRFVTKAPINEK